MPTYSLGEIAADKIRLFHQPTPNAHILAINIRATAKIIDELIKAEAERNKDETRPRHNLCSTCYGVVVDGRCWCSTKV